MYVKQIEVLGRYRVKNPFDIQWGFATIHVDMKKVVILLAGAFAAMVLSSCLATTMVAAGGVISGVEAVAETAGKGVKQVGRDVAALLPSDEAAATSTPQDNAGFVLILDGKREVDVSAFNYQRRYADSGYLYKDDGSVTEVYEVQFTGENEGTYIYTCRMADGSVVGKGQGVFRMKP